MEKLLKKAQDYRNEIKAFEKRHGVEICECVAWIQFFNGIQDVIPLEELNLTLRNCTTYPYELNTKVDGFEVIQLFKDDELELREGGKWKILDKKK